MSLDVGTDNEELLSNELYIGYRHRRLRSEEYHALVEEFVAAVQHRFPGALLQREDFKKQNAFDLLERFRERILSFNDDIQGTAAIALAAILAASHAMAIPLQNQKVVILGAGAAGIGIARQLRDALSRAGLQGDTLRRAVTVMDSQGVLVDGREIHDVYKREFAWPRELASSVGIPSDGRVSLIEVIRAQRPTVLIGTTGTPGAFLRTSSRQWQAQPRDRRSSRFLTRLPTARGNLRRLSNGPRARPWSPPGALSLRSASAVERSG